MILELRWREAPQVVAWKNLAPQNQAPSETCAVIGLPSGTPIGINVPDDILDAIAKYDEGFNA